METNTKVQGNEKKVVGSIIVFLWIRGNDQANSNVPFYVSLIREDEKDYYVISPNSLTMNQLLWYDLFWISLDLFWLYICLRLSMISISSLFRLPKHCKKRWICSGSHQIRSFLSLTTAPPQSYLV